MSLLTIIDDACNRIGISAPTSVIGSTDAQVIKLLALANKEGKELATGSSVGLSYDWQALQAEATFTTVATESQGLIATIAPNMKFIIGGTIWDRTRRLPVYGSMDPQTYQNHKAWGVTSPYPKYRIRGGILLLTPIPAAGEAYYFEYQSKNWCADSTGATLRARWVADTDIGILDEDLMTDGIVWRWKHANGFDYAEDFRMYQMNVINAIARDTERPTLDMGRQSDQRTGIVLPIGGWNA